MLIIKDNLMRLSLCEVDRGLIYARIGIVQGDIKRGAEVDVGLELDQCIFQCLGDHECARRAVAVDAQIGLAYLEVKQKSFAESRELKRTNLKNQQGGASPRLQTRDNYQLWLSGRVPRERRRETESSSWNQKIY
jgi:hypothetical protein